MSARLMNGTRDPSLHQMKDSRDPTLVGAARAAVRASCADFPANHTEIGGPTGTRGPAALEPSKSAGFSAGAAGTRADGATGPTGPARQRAGRRLDFAAINAAALRDLPALLARWLPDGRVNGREYEARNPRRADRSPGSFRVNLRTGRWSDFATGDRGGDPVSLAAYLFNLSQLEAARRLAVMLGVS